MHRGGIGALLMVVVTAFAAIVATAGPAAAVACDGSAYAPEHEYEMNFGQTSLTVLPKGLLVDAEPVNRVRIQTWAADDWSPSDEESSYFGTIQYINGVGTGGGVILGKQGGFRYTPDPAFSGIDDFWYSVLETGCNPVDEAGEDFNSVTVTVKPVLGNDTYNVVKGQTLTVPVSTGIFANDKGHDPDSLDLPATTAQGGTLDDGGAFDGSFTYTPPPGFSGTDSFTYGVYDLNFDNAYTATATINVAANATPPGAPVNLRATPGNSRVDLDWDAANGNGNTIVSYTVTRLSDNKKFDVPGTQTQRSMLNLNNGTQYTFSVRANSGAGTGPAVSKAATPRTVPGKPTNVKGTKSGSNITVSWSGTNGGASITKSKVTASNGRVVYVTGSGRSARFTGMKPGSYTFTVRSQNVAGWGPTSSRSPSVIVAQSSPTYTARFSAAEWTYLQKTARHFGLSVNDVPKTGVAVIRFILAIAPHPPTRAAARPQNTGPYTATAKYSVTTNASTMVPVSRYLVLNGNDTLKVGAALMQYFAALQGVR